MMKKYLFTSPLAAAILAAFTFAACSDSETIADGNGTTAGFNGPQAVEFSTYMGTQSTRAGYAGDITTTVLQNANAGFGVFAYYSGTQQFGTWSSWNPTTPTASTEAPNFMYNQQVTWNSGLNNWDYSPVKYWPNGEDSANEANTPSSTATQAAPQYLSFFAYAPYVNNSSTEYATDNTFVGGNLPAGVTAAVYTESVPSAVQNGIVAMSKNTETKDMYVKYILNPEADTNGKFVDLLWGLRGQKDYKEAGSPVAAITTLGTAYNTDLTKQTVDEKVKFLFKHALARVGGNTSTTNSASGNAVSGLKVVVDVDANSSTPGVGLSNQTSYFTSDFSNTTTLVTIEEVNIRDKYTYTHEDSDDSNDANSDFLTDGWFDIMNGKWDGTAAVLEHTTESKGVIYSQIAKADGSALNLNDAIKEVSTDISNTSGANWSETTRGTHSGVTTTAQDVYAANQEVPGLLLIPGNKANTLYVTVKYVVRTADSKLSTGFSEVTQTITNKVNLDGSILEPNKCYTLVMHLGLTSVKFEAVVADWATGNNQYDEEGKEETPGAGIPASVWLPSNVVTATSTPTPEP